MSDSEPPPELPQAEPEILHPERAHAAEPPPHRKRPDPLPILFGIGIIVLLAAVFYLWQHPLGQHLFSQDTTATAPAHEPAPPSPPPATLAQLAGVERQAQTATQQAQAAQQQAQTVQEQARAAQQDMQALQQRLDALEHRPAPAAPDLGPLEARLAALEKRAEQPPPVPPELAALGSRVDAMAARLEQLADRTNQLAAQGQQLASTEQQLAGRVQSSDAAAGKRLEADEARMAAIEQEAAKLAGLADRAGRIARIEAAEAALDAGQPIGDLPNAPQALARFATRPPPTEAALRLAFPAAARAAEAAIKPETADLPFWQAVKQRFASLVTVRRGDQVIVGEPEDALIARAARALDAGDLPGAVAAIGQLHGAPAAAFADWRARAEALLEARRALAALAAHAALAMPSPTRA